MLFVTLRMKIHFSHVICMLSFFSTFLLCHTIGHSPIFICQLPTCICPSIQPSILPSIHISILNTFASHTAKTSWKRNASPFRAQWVICKLVLFLAACFNFSLVLCEAVILVFISFSHVHTLFSLVKFQSTKSLSILVLF